MADEFAKFAGRFPVERAEQHAGTELSLEEYAAADLAVEEALAGNFDLLIDRLRTATVLLGIERAIAAEIIAGTLKRPNHRQAQPQTETKGVLLALRVQALMAKGMESKAAIRLVAEENGVSVSTVTKAVAKH